MYSWYQSFLKSCKNAASIANNSLRLDSLEAVHPHVPATPTVTMCTGPFTYVSSPSGRLAITDGTQMFGNGTTGTVLDWTTIGASNTSADCVTDVKVWWDPGDVIVYARRARVYLWTDVRLLSNGVPIFTYGTRRFLYRDERQDTNPDVINPLQYEMENIGEAKYRRLGVAAGTLLEMQIRIRGRMTNSQPSSWAKIYGPYRAQAGFDSWPRGIVVEVK